VLVMASAVEQHARLQTAFERPTLRLFRSSHAAVTCAVLRTLFGENGQPVRAAVLHVRVRDEIAQLAAAGVDVPVRNGEPIGGRDAAVDWMRAGLLRRESTDDGDEEYHLTAAAAEALRVTESLVEERALISRSRLGTIVDALARTAAEANPDREQQISRLSQQIVELEAERNRLAAGGEVAVASQDAIIQGLESLTNLLDQLPGDFRRVSETFATFHRELLADFHQESRHAAEVLEHYLQREDSVMNETPEGRAFTGALELLQDESVLARVRHDIEVLRDHPVFQTLLPSEQEQVRRLLVSIQQGMTQVLTQRHRISTATSNYLRGRDLIRDRELERVLRALDGEMREWMTRTRPRTKVLIESMPGPVTRKDVGQLRTEFTLDDDSFEIPPLDERSEEFAEVLSEAELRLRGGPQYVALQQAVDEHPAASAAQVFTDLGDDLRRPVDFIGLLHLSSDGVGWEEDLGTEVIEARRPDGQRVRFTVPRVLFRDDEELGDEA